MNKDTWIWAAGGILVLALLGGAVGFVLMQNNTSQNQKPKTSAATESSSGSSLLNVDDKSSISLGAGNDTLGMQTNLGNQPASNNQAMNFQEYEKYKNDPNALYAELKTGTGEVVVPDKTLTILYKGYLTDGTLVDETKPERAGGRITPLSFKMGGGQVIIGLEQGIQGMKVGGKRRIVIPPKVGYGEHGYGPVPANSVLIFDVELIALQ